MKKYVLFFALLLFVKCRNEDLFVKAVFESNGGTQITNQNIRLGGVVSKPTNPIRKGYTFENWYANKALTQLFNFKNGISKDVILYAKWKANTNKIIFNTNGGSAVLEQNILSGNKVIKPLDPLQTNYNFNGWYTNEGLTELYNFDSIVDASFTLYAKWQQYMAKFNTNGGALIDPIPTGATIVRPTDPSKQGFTFGGWYKDEGFMTEYDFNNIVKTDITIYAKWIPTICRVAFQTNGGSEISPLSIVSGNLLLFSNMPVKQGYVFMGWYKDDALTQLFIPTKDTIVTDIKLYARWAERLNLVVFNTNGGSKIDSQYIKTNFLVTQPSNPIKEDNVFINWYADELFNQQYDFSTKIINNVIIYAKWNEIVHTITFNTNGGSDIAKAKVNTGTKLVVPFTPTKQNFIFFGWFRDAALTQTYDFENNVTSSFTLYAKWHPLNTITFNSNGGENVNQQIIKYGDKVLEPTPPIRVGYEFQGWFADQALTQAYDFNTIVTNNFSLYAKWQEKVHTITINKNGGASYKENGEEINDKSVGNNDFISLNGSISRYYYNFMGWYTDEALTQPFNFSARITNSFTLYAKWQIKDNYVDVGGQVYKTIVVNGKRWMTENFTNIAYTSGNSKCYDDNAANCFVYGRLYDWDAVVSINNNLQGWHVPTIEEWDELVRSRGFYNEGSGATYDALINSVDFNAMLSGEAQDYNGYGNTSYIKLNTMGKYWSSTWTQVGKYIVMFDKSTKMISKGFNNIGAFYSIRLVQNQ